MAAADSDFHALWMQDLEYPARLDRVFADNIWTAGVLGSSSFEVTPSAPAALTVDVATGVAVVEGADQANQGKYLVRKQTPQTGLAIGAAPGSGQRNDLIVLEVRDPNATGPAGDDVRLLVVVGTPDASPVDPTPPVTSLVLARVRVPSGTGSIDASLIDDLRVSADSQHDVLGVPAGTILDTLRDTAPEGYELMQGQTLTNAQTVFPKLWDALPAAFKSGSNIILPDMRGRITIGAGQGSGLTNRVLGATGGAETHTLTTSEMPSHTHVQNSHNHTQNSHNHTQNSHNHTQNIHNHGVRNPIRREGTGTAFTPHEPGTPFTANVGSTTATNQAATATNQPTTATNNAATAVNQNTGGSGAHNNMQPFVVTNKMIRVR
jgi:microcystin-dependent protein